MKYVTAVLILGVAGAFGMAQLAAQSDASVAKEHAPQQWQHLALEHDLTRDNVQQETSRQIVRLGEEGWQLVDVETFCKEGTTEKTVYYFKRER